MELTVVLNTITLFLFFASLIAVLKDAVMYVIEIAADRKRKHTRTESVILWLSLSYILTYIFA